MEKDELKKDRVKKLHISFTKMMLMASSADEDLAATDLAESCKSFMNSKTAGLADQELSLQFVGLLLSEVGFALVQALHVGRFTYYDPSAQSNFSIFCFYEREPVQCKQQPRTILLLHMAETQRQGKTVDEIKALAKQMVKTPEDFNVMHQQLLFFEGTCKIFLGPHSCGTRSISNLSALLTRYKQHFKNAAVSDKLFPTKFL